MSESTPPDPLARLGEEIDKARARRGSGHPQAAGPSNLRPGRGLGRRPGIELVVAVVVAAAIGWAIDHWLGTRPWGMIVLFFMGVAAGMLNVYRAVTGVGGAVGYRRPAKSNTDAKRWDDEDC